MIMKMWNYSIVATKFNITFPEKKILIKQTNDHMSILIINS